MWCLGLPRIQRAMKPSSSSSVAAAAKKKKPKTKPSKVKSTKGIIIETEKQKKQRAPAQKLVDCHGTRTGTFSRMIRFTNHMVFGKDAGVRMQSDFKEEARALTERIMTQFVIREGKNRRLEGDGKRLMGPNIVGAFAAFTSLVDPSLFSEFKRMTLIDKLYNKKMRNADAVEAWIQKQRCVAKFADLIKQNVETAKRTKVAKITDYGTFTEGEDRTLFSRYCIAALITLKLKPKANST